MINTELFSARLRERAIDLVQKKILIARLSESSQEADLKEPVNCQGYGRVRHFQLDAYPNWSPNPLPILPAAKALNRPAGTGLRAQVFQNSACNWRCWYCFVDSDRLSANLKVSEYFAPDELISMYLDEQERAEVIDLTGGQPDLVPEWVLWTMQTLERKGLSNNVFLWSDDNLSNRYFWEFLNPQQRKYMVDYRKYARVACFKGYDEMSFSFNTLATPELFEQQFEIYHGLLQEGFDMYAYVTFTSPRQKELSTSMRRFVDRLQQVHFNLPLRTVPLKIRAFTPTQGRMKPIHEEALKFQQDVHDAWLQEITKRFSPEERLMPICDVKINL